MASRDSEVAVLPPVKIKGVAVGGLALRGPAGFVVPLVLAFFYTFLYNTTSSVLLCILLHAGLTAAQDHLLFAADSMTVDLVLLTTYVFAAAAVIVLTRGRLGKRRSVNDHAVVPDEPRSSEE
jgi:hypothetical protein